MSKLTKQQIINGLCYSKAMYDFIKSPGFNDCFEKLTNLTWDILESLKYDNIPQFDNFTDPWEYLGRLESVFDYVPNDWQSNLEKLFVFFSEVNNYGKETFKELSNPLENLKETLKNLHKGKDMVLKLETDEAMDTYEVPTHESDSVPQPEPVIKYHSEYSLPKVKKFNLEECYAINETGKRGLCLIVNIFRPGAYTDVADGIEIFQNLNYDVKSYDNITSVDFIHLQKNIRKKIEELNSDSFIFIFSSHGDEENVLFVDNKVKREEIVMHFLPKYCPFLEGKPKLFLFQNCRGTDSYPRIEKADVSPVDPSTPGNNKQVESSYDSEFYSAETVSKSMPRDIVRYFATTKGHVAYRQDAGTLFLQALYEILRDDKHIGKSFNDIQPILTGKVLESSKLHGDQLPECQSTLLKHFYFKHPDM